MQYLIIVRLRRLPCDEDSRRVPKEFPMEFTDWIRDEFMDSQPILALGFPP